MCKEVKKLLNNEKECGEASIKSRLLDELFELRQEDEELIELNSKDEEELDSIMSQRAITAEELKQALIKIGDKEKYDEIDSILRRKLNLDFKYSYFYNKKYYMAGVKDGIRMVLEGLYLK